MQTSEVTEAGLETFEEEIEETDGGTRRGPRLGNLGKRVQT